MAREGYLGYYAARLDTVEINNTFYEMPDVETLRSWRDKVPTGFTFAVKASRYITHMKNLKDPVGPVGRFLERVAVLGPYLGPVLFQLPPWWGLDEERLQSFLDALPPEQRVAFEFRDPSWLSETVYELLESHGAGFCIYDLQGRVSPKRVTADFVYVRLHGPQDAYHGGYDMETLSGWVGACSSWARMGKDVYCYFNNDAAGHAVANAQTMAAMVESIGSE
jgi:uncharacterized protein YecE (DUF72 family)